MFGEKSAQSVKNACSLSLCRNTAVGAGNQWGSGSRCSVSYPPTYSNHIDEHIGKNHLTLQYRGNGYDPQVILSAECEYPGFVRDAKLVSTADSLKQSRQYPRALWAGKVLRQTAAGTGRDNVCRETQEGLGTLSLRSSVGSAAATDN